MISHPLKATVRRYFPSLTHRNFLLFWTGQGVSVIGTWMQNVGQAWLVLQLTNSPLKLGIVSAMQFLPVMVLSLVAGPFVDRYPKRKMIIFTQTSLMLLALILATLTLLHVVQYWHIVVLALLLGLVNTIDIPTRQAFVIELAGREDLMNAISLNSTVFNMARIFGPAVAGILIGAIGIAPCFYLNGISFLAVIISLFFIRVPDFPGSPAAGSAAPPAVHRGLFDGVLASIREGLAYIARKPTILFPLVLMALLSTFVMNYNIFVPTFAKIDLHGDATTFGFLMTAMGVGSFLGAFTLTVRSAGVRKVRQIILGGLGMSTFLAISGMQRGFLLSCALLAVTGYFSVTFAASCNGHIQSESEDGMRGRVMSVYSLVFGGVTPIGSLYAGNLVDVVGPGACMIVSGGIGFVATLWMALAAGRRRRRAALARGL